MKNVFQRRINAKYPFCLWSTETQIYVTLEIICICFKIICFVFIFLFFSLLEFSVFISLVCNEIYFVFYMWRLNVDCWSFRSKKRRWWSTRRTCWQVTTRSPALVGACHRTLHAATPVMQPWASRDSASSSSSHLSWRVTFSLLSSSASLTRLR